MKIFSRISPVVRLTLGVMMLTVSLLLISDLLGLVPDTTRPELSARKAIAETLAVQASGDLRDEQVQSLQRTLDEMVERNRNVLSIGIRLTNGVLLLAAGDHAALWQPADPERSTVTHVRVPLFREGERWAVVEIRFADLHSSLFGLRGGSAFLAVILFMAFAGSFAYFVFLKRALKELDPGSVVPDRVRAALDALTEGLVILDTDENVVFANIAFARKLGKTQELLIGRSLGDLGWCRLDEQGQAIERPMPWSELLKGELRGASEQARLRCNGDRACTFVVNVAAIRSPDDSVRGVLATFDDVTELERKNLHLTSTLTQLEKSQLEITRKNKELQVLATRDPLTGVLNRRSLFDGLNQIVKDALASGEEVSCLMIDIDHFKSINDRFGHAKGDKVIKLLADTLVESVRGTDLVGRYGGEEFCVALPGVDLVQAEAIAEQIRVAVVSGKDIRFIGGVRISASFGVSSMKYGAGSPSELVDQADKALYAAKQGGRNRVVTWPEVLRSGTATVAAAGATEAGERGSGKGQEALAQENADLQRRITALESLLKEEGERAPTEADIAEMPSRSVLLDRIKQGVERSRRYATKLAVVALEIATVQRIFETMGHGASERLVEGVAHRLRNALRSSDTVALSESDNPVVSFSRTGHGEFVVLITDLSDAESATWIVRRLFEGLTEPLILDGGPEIFLGYSAGVSLYPADSDDPEVLLSCAGAALSEVKLTQSPDQFMYYCSDMNRRSREQIRIENHLHRAIERDELSLEYQPRVDLNTGRITGVEALLRWRNAELGAVSPMVFVPVAEHTGVIHQIGDWVMKTACAQLHAWHLMGFADLSMSINLSPVQFRDQNLGARIIDIIRTQGVTMKSVSVEITESVLMQNLDSAADAIRTLHDAGVHVALDDFGTGYSSLGYLKRLPIDEVKVDRSFLRDFPHDAQDATIVSAIIAMAQALDIEVVVEGVENEAQLMALHTLQCSEIQGFFISPPLAPDKMLDFLRDSAAVRQQVRPPALGGRAANETIAEPADFADVLNQLPARTGSMR